ncbi:MAG TPA: CPBP family intramembrane glutamic endopeptidase [Steroidobacteraceae bacterium]|nr:CPBP family intramembrane glutamic endopeptidase [Steroidobacteraceae bacterium]
MPGTDTTPVAPPAPRRLPTVLGFMPVQLLLLFVILAAVDVACQLLGARLVHVAPAPLGDAARLLAALMLSLAMIAAYRSLIELLEQRTAQELRGAGAARELAAGVLAGTALFAFVYLILWAAGAATWEALNGFAGLGRALAVAIASAVGEEIVFRGVVFRRLEGALGTGIALIVSAAIFGLVHAGNAGASWISTLAIALESGVLLGICYAATRSLWLPIGVHFGWNFTEGGIFGAAVSGGHYQGLIGASLSGPAWLTGGAFGPEASLPALIVSLCASAALGWYVVRHGAWRPPSWRLRAHCQ